MTTPSGTISMQDILTETGATGAVSFNDWYVRHVAKTDTGTISMSSMRSKTVHPAINEGAFGRTYVGYAFYATFVGTDMYWTRHPSNGQITIYTNGLQRWNAVSSTASSGYVDTGGIRYFKDTVRETGPDWERSAIRWVEG